MSALAAWWSDDQPYEPPLWVHQWCIKTRLDIEHVRWCDWCRTVSRAQDDYQRSSLDAAGFYGGFCPDCRVRLLAR